MVVQNESKASKLVTKEDQSKQERNENKHSVRTQVSTVPVTRTTVTTVTTTYITSFPSIEFSPPRSLPEADPREYPLSMTNTPAQLRKITVDVDGRSTLFQEADGDSDEKSLITLQNIITPSKIGKTDKSKQKLKNSVISSQENIKLRNKGKQPQTNISNHGNSSNEHADRKRPVSMLSSSDESSPVKPVSKKIRARLCHKINHQSQAPDVTPKKNTDGVSKEHSKEEDGNVNITYDNLRPPILTPTAMASPSLIDGSGENLSNNNTVPKIGQTSSNNNILGITESNTPPHLPISLPSPTLSPLGLAAKNACDSDIESMELEEEEEEEDAIDENGKAEEEGMESLANNIQLREVMNIPAIVRSYDTLPVNVQSYLMFHLLRRSHKRTLQVLSRAIEPVLKRDFLSLLPLELSMAIIRMLDVKSLCRAVQVSKKWKSLIESDEWTWRWLFSLDGFRRREDETEEILRSMSSTQSTASSSSLQSKADDTPTECVKRKSIRNSLRSARGHSATPLSSSLSPKKSDKKTDDQRSDNEEHTEEQEKFNAAKYYKELYRRHYSTRMNWMDPAAEPQHISFQGHGRNVVTCLQFDTDKVVTGSDDACVNIYDINTGSLRKRLFGHEGGVWALRYEGNMLVSGSTDRTTRVWNMETGECTQVFYGHTSTVRCLQILTSQSKPSSDEGSDSSERVIVTGSRDATLRIWKLPKEGDPNLLPPPPDSENLEASLNNALAQNPYFIRKLEGHTQSVRAIAGYGDTLVSGSYDCTVRVWEVSTGRSVWKLSGHTQKVYSVVYDRVNHRCISGSMDWTVKVWDLHKGTCTWTLEGKSFFFFFFFFFFFC